MSFTCTIQSSDKREVIKASVSFTDDACKEESSTRAAADPVVVGGL